ncbi:hypothetical protein [Planobispora rosea]|uniref:hypothetical protein n=1 Tax=Planobispora rosea TaxID=35762 RepID=UPI00114CE246|nr:hypothetical protein [Planobispora rosea]
MNEPTVRPTRYDVTCLPPDDINTHSYTITVEYRGHDRWAVLDGPYALDANGDADYEPRPSERDDEWLATHRFDLDTALAIAKKAAPLMTVNGQTVEQALAFIASRA